jgi:phosphate transport system protein
MAADAVVYRATYADKLDAVRDELVEMTRLVRVAVARATRALLDGDARLAEQVITADALVDALRERVEERSFELLSLQNPVARDLRMLVASLRIVSEVERIGDLAGHVAKVARLRAPEIAVPDDLEPTVARMATLAADMIGRVERIIATSDVDAALDLEEVDEEMDQLRRATFRELMDSSWSHGVEPAVDIALLGRYYERIADHAVSAARRVVFLVTGEQPV